MKQIITSQFATCEKGKKNWSPSLLCLLPPSPPHYLGRISKSDYAILLFILPTNSRAVIEQLLARPYVGCWGNKMSRTSLLAYRNSGVVGQTDMQINTITRRQELHEGSPDGSQCSAGGWRGAESKSPASEAWPFPEWHDNSYSFWTLALFFRHCLIYPQNPSIEELWLLFHKQENWGVEK